MASTSASPEQGTADIAPVPLIEVLRFVGRARWTLIAGLLIGALLGLAAGQALTKKYRADAVLMVVSPNEGRMSGLTEQLGGLASLVGVDIGSLDQQRRGDTDPPLAAPRSHVHRAREADAAAVCGRLGRRGPGVAREGPGRAADDRPGSPQVPRECHAGVRGQGGGYDPRLGDLARSRARGPVGQWTESRSRTSNCVRERSAMRNTASTT